jgi:hypothetical protein
MTDTSMNPGNANRGEVIPLHGRDPMDTPTGRRQCTAHARSGERCKNRPVPGGTVCRMHGGAAPAVRNRARLRLLSLAEPAIATLAREMTTATDSANRIKAANSILDRSGYARTVRVDQADAREMLLDLLIQSAEEQAK